MLDRSCGTRATSGPSRTEQRSSKPFHINQCERYLAALLSLKRQKGDSTVWRLMPLAVSTQTGTLWEVISRDAFLDALGDTVDRVRVLAKDSKTREKTLKLVCCLEAISKSSTPSGDNFDNFYRRSRIGVEKRRSGSTLRSRRVTPRAGPLSSGDENARLLKQLRDESCGHPTTVPPPLGTDH